MLPFQAAKQQQGTVLYLAGLVLLQCQCRWRHQQCHLQQQAEQAHQ
jgi:hypothetical protein